MVMMGVVVTVMESMLINIVKVIIGIIIMLLLEKIC